MKTLRLAFLAAAASTVLAAPALADTFTYVLNGTSFTVAPGGTYEVSGTISAASSNTESYYLSDSITNSGPVTLDDTDFLNTPFPLAPGEVYNGPLFTIEVAADATAGTYSDFFDVGFALDSDLPANVVLSGPIEVNVGSGTSSVTPEPGSWLLLSTGLASVGMLRRRFGSSRA